MTIRKGLMLAAVTSGFLIVLAIGGIVYFDVPVAIDRFDESKLKVVAEDLENFRKATGRFPTPEEGLQVLTRQVGAWKPHPLVAASLVDSWGNELVYRTPATLGRGNFDLYSRGPNGVDDAGGSDDIVIDVEE
jgi:general secretion pathway protein G